MTFDYFVELGKKKQPQKTEEFTTAYHQTIAEDKNNKKDADQLRNSWAKLAGKVSLPKPQETVWEMIAQPKIDLSLLPFSSWCLSFQFTLAKPYISKDDNPFYIIDNPIVRDKVFHLPMVRPTSWKGNLYSTLWQLGYDKSDDSQMQRLFGTTLSEESGQAGRLFFYPTFFTQTGLEIINPHDRKRRVGKNPIYLECVPAGAKGTFSLLYVPFDLIGKPEKDIRQQAAEDLQRVAEGLQAMFLTYGFSAKRTSGYGVAEDDVENGRILTNLLEAVQQAPRPEEPTMPDVLRTFLEMFPDEDFRLKPNEWRKQRGATSSQRRQYMEARAGFAKYQEDRKAYEAKLAEWEAQAAEPMQIFVQSKFTTFKQLVEKAAPEVADKLNTGGAV